ncbi:NfeD family protein [Salirhabdus salicampi]|uniref:NfeD family protein n=1 Tax=Salirhabdus salicampi TaxID=476102 RepID=UPI0020C467E5|nr:nodulation protein NfeD [Salirhabdus salicampi]MCP8616905.1 nodulation protein NfeD [Salirhabdus salicampi]
MKKVRLIGFFLLFLICLPLSILGNEGNGKLVYVIPIENNVERGLEAFLDRSINSATENGADHIIFEINTPGGRVDAAGHIGELLQSIDIPNSAYIINQALSAGSYIALNTDSIYMKPGSTMGASGVITSDGNAAEEKAQSAWIAAMTAAAEANNRDPIYAEAMANPEIDLPEYRAPEGKFLTLNPKEAVEVGYAEGIAENRTELLALLNLTGATVETIEPTFAEKIARFITDPVVVPILLSIASLGFIIELYSPGFGFAGMMGLASLLLFFYGHLIAGMAGFESIILLLLGIILIVLELFVPGGILGLIGGGAIFGSLLLASNDIGHMALSIGIALIVSIVVSIILFKTVGMEKGFFRHLILKEATTTEEGYVSTVNRHELIGKQGKTITPLRPSGTALFENERLDVVTEGGYISEGSHVTIVKVEGSRIVVRAKES